MGFFSKLFSNKSADTITDPANIDFAKTEYDVLYKIQRQLEEEVRQLCEPLRKGPPRPPRLPPCYIMNECSSKRFYTPEGIVELKKLISLHKTLTAITPKKQTTGTAPSL